MSFSFISRISLYLSFIFIFSCQDTISSLRNNENIDSEDYTFQLETEEFHRLKLGIAIDELNMKPSEHYVLKPFPKQYEELVNQTTIKAADALDFYFENSIVETMNKYN